MVTDVRKIIEVRKPERDGKAPEMRQAEALELIADTLEAMRIEALGLNNLLARILPTLAPRSGN